MSETVTQRVDNSWAWMLAATPVLFLLVDAALLYAGYATTGVGLAVAFVAQVALVLADRAALRRAGEDVSIWWGILLLPVYLILRARATGQTFAPAAMWLAALVVSVAGYALLSNSFAVLDQQAVEEFVKETADEFYGTSQDVDCPDREVYRVGARFFCDVTDDEGVGQFAVTVQDADGYVTILPIG